MIGAVSPGRTEVPQPTRAHLLAVLAVTLLGHGDAADFAALFAHDAVNRPGDYAPAACRGTGPAAVLATSRWLRGAFADLNWRVQALAADGPRVVVRTAMTGHHTGPLILHTHGVPGRIIPATGVRFAVTRTYRFRVAGDRIVERSTDFGELGTLEKDPRQ